jgi:hypothetical protein
LRCGLDTECCSYFMNSEGPSMASRPGHRHTAEKRENGRLVRPVLERTKPVHPSCLSSPCLPLSSAGLFRPTFTHAWLSKAPFSPQLNHHRHPTSHSRSHPAAHPPRDSFPRYKTTPSSFSLRRMPRTQMCSFLFRNCRQNLCCRRVGSLSSRGHTTFDIPVSRQSHLPEDLFVPL